MQKDFPLVNKEFSDLNPLIVGYEDCESEHKYGPAIREYYLIHYVVKGKGKLYANGQTFPVHKGEIFIIKPHEVITYIADKDIPWSYIWIGFNGKLSQRIDALPSPVLRYEKDTFIQMKQAEQFKSTREEYLSAKLFEMFSELFEGHEKGSDYVKQTADYISNNYMKPNISVERIANLIGLDRRYLSRIFKQRMGVTMQQYLIQKRMEHAVGLLNSGYLVHQAASLVGYVDVFHFSKMFKKIYGISPDGYKNHF